MNTYTLWAIKTWHFYIWTKHVLKFTNLKKSINNFKAF